MNLTAECFIRARHEDGTKGNLLHDTLVTPLFLVGQGGGFYDRALPGMSGWKIALVHSGEVTSEVLPREDHDIAVDAAATPDLVVRFRRN